MFPPSSFFSLCFFYKVLRWEQILKRENKVYQQTEIQVLYKNAAII